MRKLALFLVPVVLVAMVGCSKPAEDTKSTSETGPIQGPGKEGVKAQGMSNDQVGVTEAGKGADAATGSALNK